jgi:hypothetical protein
MSVMMHRIGVIVVEAQCERIAFVVFFLSFLFWISIDLLLLTRQSDQLKWYTEYCANQPQALAMLDSLNTENKMFQDYNTAWF